MPVIEQILTVASNDVRDIYRLLQSIGKEHIDIEEKEIEWYNNQKNLGIKIVDILQTIGKDSSRYSDTSIQHGLLNIISICRILLFPDCHVNLNDPAFSQDLIPSIMKILQESYENNRSVDIFRSELYRFLLYSIKQDTKLKSSFITQILQNIIDLLDIEISYADIIDPPNTQLLICQLIYLVIQKWSKDDKIKFFDKYDIQDISLKLSSITHEKVRLLSLDSNIIQLLNENKNEDYKNLIKLTEEEKEGIERETAIMNSLDPHEHDQYIRSTTKIPEVKKMSLNDNIIESLKLKSPSSSSSSSSNSSNSTPSIKSKSPLVNDTLSPVEDLPVSHYITQSGSNINDGIEAEGKEKEERENDNEIVIPSKVEKCNNPKFNSYFYHLKYQYKNVFFIYYIYIIIN